MIKSTSIQIFLSCSFHEEDKEIVEFFASICHGLGIQCVNVDKGFGETPQETARQLVSDSRALLAIATCRDEMTKGNFMMPKAVSEEITMAFTNKKPILIFAENGVDMEQGFISPYHTHLRFNRESLADPKFLKKAIESIHGLKMGVISPEDLQVAQRGQEHIFAEDVRHLVELVEQSGSLVWRYSITRRLKFTSRFTEAIQHGAWEAVPPSETRGCNIKWSARFHNGNKAFKLTPTEEVCTGDNCQISLNIEPKPEANDFIEYSVLFESPYLNPVFLEDIRDPRAKIIINETEFLCTDGMVPIVRTQNLKIHFRFPPILGLKPEDFVPIVGSYTNKIDYLFESEIKRMIVNKENFGGNVLIDIYVQSPLLQHMYGVAWNPVKRPFEVT